MICQKSIVAMDDAKFVCFAKHYYYSKKIRKVPKKITNVAKNSFSFFFLHFGIQTK